MKKWVAEMPSSFEDMGLMQDKGQSKADVDWAVATPLG